MLAASVIITARDAATTIGATLEAIAGQDLGRPFELIVIDNGSSDRTADVIQEFAAASDVELTLISGPGKGAGLARNVGSQRARSEVLAFTDADCQPEPGWLRAGIEALAHADLVQGAVRPTPQPEPRPFDRTLWVVRETGLYETANLFMRRDLFERLGGFEDWLGDLSDRPIAEDVWLGWRARRSGARTAFEDSAVVHHAVFRGTTGALMRERRRLFWFPFIARKVPELRQTLFWRRIFLNRRSATLDAALLSILPAITLRSSLPLVAALPYGVTVARSAVRWRRSALRVAIGEVAADLIGCAALVAGSVRSRSVVI